MRAMVRACHAGATRGSSPTLASGRLRTNGIPACTHLVRRVACRYLRIDPIPCNRILPLLVRLRRTTGCSDMSFKRVMRSSSCRTSITASCRSHQEGAAFLCQRYGRASSAAVLAGALIHGDRASADLRLCICGTSRERLKRFLPPLMNESKVQPDNEARGVQAD